jgi:hypothetical protein
MLFTIFFSSQDSRDELAGILFAAHATPHCADSGVIIRAPNSVNPSRLTAFKSKLVFGRDEVSPANQSRFNARLPQLHRLALEEMQAVSAVGRAQISERSICTSSLALRQFSSHLS